MAGEGQTWGGVGEEKVDDHHRRAALRLGRRPWANCVFMHRYVLTVPAPHLHTLMMVSHSSAALDCPRRTSTRLPTRTYTPFHRARTPPLNGQSRAQSCTTNAPLHGPV